MKQMRWPDFIVIGAGKSGTTALNDYLRQHPAIFMSKRKEPNFFALESIDPNTYEIEESRQYHFKSVYRKEDYLNLFAEAKPEQVCGEISNLYLNSSAAPGSIKKYVPEARIIAILRHPADRLFSRYLHLVREDEVPEDGLEGLFDKESTWWKRPDLVSEGFYYNNLKRFYDLFPEDQIRVYIYDDFKKDPLSTLKDIFRFINVDQNVKIETDMVSNKSGKRKDNLFNKFLGQNGIIINVSRRIIPDFHEKLKVNKTVRKYLDKARNKNLETEKMSSELRNRITDEIYKEDILKLGDLLHRDLSGWLKKKEEQNQVER